jgi:poly(3-hydroxybutyrate) depolymerase
VIYLEGHGHEWAGGQPRRVARRTAGKPSSFNATDAIWEFFAQQIPTPEPASR